LATTTVSSSFVVKNGRTRRARRVKRARHAEVEKRARLASGELGLDIYSMRQKLADRGLRYEDAPPK